MKTRLQGGLGRAGTGRFEVLLIVVGLGLLACVGCASLHSGAGKTERARCLVNLKLIGVGLQMWLHDYEDKFPWQIPVAQGGSAGLAQISDHFLRLSNYFGSPSILSCPGLARHRPPTQVWARLTDRNISYALYCDSRIVMDMSPANASARPPLPDSVVMDMDLEGGRPSECRQCPGNVYEFNVGPNSPLRWSRTNHVNFGNVAMLDGTVVSLPNRQSKESVAGKDQQGQTVHILLPR